MSASDVLIAGNATVAIAPYGAPLPESAIAELDATYIDVGFTSTEGVRQIETPRFSYDREWGSLYPNLALTTGHDTIFEFTPLETTEFQAELAYAGGTWSDVGVERRFDPPTSGTPPFLSVVIDLEDGRRRVRLVVDRAVVTSPVDQVYTRNEPAVSAIRLSALPLPGETPWYLIEGQTPLSETDVRSYVLYGNGAPDSDDATEAFDEAPYVDVETGDVWLWDGAGLHTHRVLLVGHGVPDADDGIPFDAYLDLSSGDLYVKE